MPQWISKDELFKVYNMFKDFREIWTQNDIIQFIGLTQPAVSEALAILEQQGILCWVRNEGINQVKFYSKISNKVPKMLRRKIIPIIYEKKWIEVEA